MDAARALGALRVMVVLDPLKVTLINYAEDQETLQAPWHQQQDHLGSRSIPFGPTFYIEREDFAEVPPKKFKRLSPGEMVRLRYGYIIRCDEVVKDGEGRITELRCTYFPDSKSGADTSGLKPKGVIHWVETEASVPVRVRLYERLFREPAPSASTFLEDLNPDSMREVEARAEPAIMDSTESRFQFERIGYFCRDSELDNVFNRTVTLRDSWKP